MALAPGWCALYQNKPNVNITSGAGIKEIDLTPVSENNKLSRCAVIDLTTFIEKQESNGHNISIIDGLGYDWKVLKLGNSTESAANAYDRNGDRVEYALPYIDSDTVNVYVYALPLWPLHKEGNNSFGVAVDDKV